MKASEKLLAEYPYLNKYSSFIYRCALRRAMDEYPDLDADRQANYWPVDIAHDLLLDHVDFLYKQGKDASTD